VPDQHHRIGGLGECTKPFEQFLFRGGVELSRELDRAALAERGLDRFERLASAKRRGAEHESGTDPLPTQVLGDAPRGAFASRRERAVDVGKGRIRPARLSVPKQDDSSHSLTVPVGRSGRQAALVAGDESALSEPDAIGRRSFSLLVSTREAVAIWRQNDTDPQAGSRAAASGELGDPAAATQGPAGAGVALAARARLRWVTSV
jgi:hypothetical protein